MAGDIVWSIIIIVGSLVFALIASLVLFTWLKSDRLRLRDPINKKKYVTDYWVMEKHDKNTGCKYWVSAFWQSKIKVQMPPGQVIDVGKKGRKYAEAYINGHDGKGLLEVTWVRDPGLNKDSVLSKNGKLMSETFDPFTVTDKSTLTDHFIKAMQRKNKVWDLNKIMNMAFLGVFIIAVVMGMIFAPDVIDSWNGVAAQNAKSSESIAQSTQHIENILGMMQKDPNIEYEIVPKLESKKTGNVVESPDEEPPETEE